MLAVTKWETFDGKLFDTEEEARVYETEHLFFNQKRIIFYSNNGNIIDEPCESVFLDSNRFKVYDIEALDTYRHYCHFLGIAVPHAPKYNLVYPLHYRFNRGGWECVEESIADLKYSIMEEYKDEIELQEEERHTLAEDDG